jgi:hypothetical protein
MEYIFISANEQLDSGLLQSQLVRPIEQHLAEANPWLVSLHRPFGRKYPGGRRPAVNIPVLVPYRFINFTWLFWLNDMLCLMYALAVHLALYRRGAPRQRTVVCRGYVVGLVGWWLQRLFGYQVVFDPRSLYVHEQLGSGAFPSGSWRQRYWLWVERRILRCAVRVVGVSQGQLDYYGGLGIPFEGVLIPCYGSPVALLDAEARAALRARLGYGPDDVVLCYFGSLNQGWNNLDVYLPFFRRAVAADHRLLVISQDAAALRDSPLAALPHTTIVTLEEAVSMVDRQVLQVADFGVVMMSEVPDWKTRLSVKFAEYTCHGIPVLVNRFVGEAARLVTEAPIAPSAVIDAAAPLPPLGRIDQAGRARIQHWAASYFAPANIRKALAF